MALEPADETLGRYRLFARLGRGGMAELHVARMTGVAGVEKFVVIKRMLRHLAEDPQFVAMFENEGRIAVRLNHPNVCQAYELDTVNGQLFLAMELVRGLPWSTVAARLPGDELATCRFIVGVMTQACEGLHYAHHLTDDAGNLTPVVHRDVSPGNLMITNDGAIKLLDFGVSKVLTDDDATRAGMIKGKLPYMAPEHIRGGLVDSRADIFSLGVVMWEALARRSLFERPSDLQIFKAIVEDSIPPLPQTPIIQRLEVVLRRALARERGDRQASARQLADELRDALAPTGLPMTQAQIQAAMSEWLSFELANAQQDLAAAISRLRASDVRRMPDREATRTSIDFMVGRAAETQVGSLASEELDTEDEAPTRHAANTEDEATRHAARTADEAPTARAPGSDDEAPTRTPHKRPVVRMDSEPSLTTVAPTAPRAVVTPRPAAAAPRPGTPAASPMVTPAPRPGTPAASPMVTPAPRPVVTPATRAVVDAEARTEVAPTPRPVVTAASRPVVTRPEITDAPPGVTPAARAGNTPAPPPVVTAAARAVAPRPGITPAPPPVLDEDAIEPSETRPTAPRQIPYRAVSEEPLMATQPYRVPVPSAQPQHWPTPMPGPAPLTASNTRTWIIVVALLSVLVGVFVAVLLS